MLQHYPLLYAFWALREGLTTQNKVSQLNAVWPTRDNTTVFFWAAQLVVFRSWIQKKYRTQEKVEYSLDLELCFGLHQLSKDIWISDSFAAIFCAMSARTAEFFVVVMNLNQCFLNFHLVNRFFKITYTTIIHISSNLILRIVIFVH